jgi:peptidoglycan/LPS O-acetylase OafA/YrhL
MVLLGGRGAEVYASNTTSLKMSKRIPQLDGIRGLAILLVLVWHFFSEPLLDSAHGAAYVLGRISMFTWSGVDLFFVLSGFLIGGILIDSRGAERYFSTFYIRRFFRIIPVYFLACLAYFPLLLLVRVALNAHYQHMPWYVYATFSQNFWLNDLRWHTFLCQSWSLAVEEQFYLTLPLVIWLLDPRKLWKYAIAGIVVAPVLRALIWLQHGEGGATAAYTLLLCRIDVLLVGVLAAIGIRDQKWKAKIEANRRYLACFAVAWVVVLCGLAAANVGGWGNKFSVVTLSGFALFYVCILLLAITSHGSMRRLLSHPFFRWFGTLAYALYLVHSPLLEVSKALFRDFPVFATASALAASIGIAYLSWTLLESRMIAIGHGFTYRSEDSKVVWPLAVDSTPKDAIRA